MTITMLATSHGTDVPAAREAISALVAAVGETAPHVGVREAFVDVQDPRIDSAVATTSGLAVVVPLLLAPGFHVHVDIAQAADRPGVVAAATLGPDDRLTEVMLRRLVACRATRDDVVVLAAAGSTDQRARGAVSLAADLLARARGSSVAVGYVGGSGERLADVVAAVRRPGRRVVVVSYLMAPGFFHDRLLSCGADVVSEPLLTAAPPEPELVSLVLDRFADAARQLDWSASAGRSRSESAQLSPNPSPQLTHA